MAQLSLSALFNGEKGVVDVGDYPVGIITW
jgi:hypothetical protein